MKLFICCSMCLRLTRVFLCLKYMKDILHLPMGTQKKSEPDPPRSRTDGLTTELLETVVASKGEMWVYRLRLHHAVT